MVFAKKSFGQHFLINEFLAHRISESLAPYPQYKQVLEVGPGRGMLSKYLVTRYPDLTMVDADRDMIDVLKKDPRFATCRLVLQDFLKLDLKALFHGQPLLIIGNFPYNISSQIVFKMLEYREYVPAMVGMFQKEMAERIAHAPGSRAYGVISVLTQAYFDVEYLFSIHQSDFNPPPKVKSGVLRFTRKAKLHLDCDEDLFKIITKTCFLQKRKMIRNSLKTWLSPETLQDIFFDKRPEQLAVVDFVKITLLATDRAKKT